MPELSSFAKLLLWKDSGNPAACSANPATYSARTQMVAAFTPDSVAGFPPESVAGLARNTHPSKSLESLDEIRSSDNYT